jgi:release factor glutamine methyltransferase
MPTKSWTIRDLLRVTTDYLNKKGIESPRLTSDILLAHQLKTARMALYLNFDQPLTEKEVAGYRSFIKRRLLREPLQYITGLKEFWSLDFLVDPAVLIPRPETELLVERTIQTIKGYTALENDCPSILDLGTGCGAIAISLAKELPKAKIYATDISVDALRVAEINAQKHGVSDRIRFLQGDLWDALSGQRTMFRIVLSNPPYIPAEAYEDLSPEIRDYEPRLALDGHEGGMHFIERIISEAPAFISPGGWLMVEMAPNQTDRALTLMGRIGAYGEKTRIKDYSHHYRVVVAQRV